MGWGRGGGGRGKDQVFRRLTLGPTLGLRGELPALSDSQNHWGFSDGHRHVAVIVVHVCFSSLLSPSLFFFISYTSIFSGSKNKRKKEKENKSEKRTNSVEELLSRGLDNVLAGVG